ncbi:hypothetical protein DEU36_2903 [Microbacterium sp. AG238]|nr:hypothetical protein DEU36_2903 [Microbacterium sp. AG238]
MAKSGDMDVKFNRRTMDGILRSPQIVAETRAIAEAGLSTIRSTAPVDSGEYRDGFVLERREARYRTVWRAVGRDAKTLLIESKLGIIARAFKAVRRRG